jgi:4-aminobutyrate aminotransferase / (S)-3-amino-2-methylpropionate transaminase / 5-aminovalerate transaminase
MAGYMFSREPKTVALVETKYRKIATQIPTPGTKEIIARLEKTESRSMQGQFPIIWDKAEDFSVYDIAGNKWIDFTSTIFVANIGHGNKRVSAAIKEVLDKPLVSTYAYMSEVRAKYLEKLIEFAGPPFGKAFLLSAGTEATEATLKLIRMHGQKIGKKKPGIVTLNGNWHGRTMGAQMMSSNAAQKAWIGYEDPNIHHIDFPYPWLVSEELGEEFFNKQLESLKQRGLNLETDIAGFMLETFQGWGALFYPKSFVKAIRKFTEENSILLAFDEMQAGFARTGKKFGFEHYEVSPDLFACGKGMGGGVSLSGVIGRIEIMDLPEVGNMSSTHSANPLVCAAGLAVLEEIESRNIVAETARKGKLLKNLLSDLLNKYPLVLDNYYGEGLIASLIFKDYSNHAKSELASLVSEKCMQKGLLVVHTGRESIKLGPPLIITDEAMMEAVQIIDESINEIILHG